ncbi:hypothetical protein BAURA86_04109 [Brevibacterium aurantiacum]|uniref:Uncharacterized protein n=1 Tax=Brevibacterium aurantiacum TaxID=273384 RepID=A0A2H1L0Y7_BREAU|nr:hypothetical protein [Brevibacterium aurantiacum]SMY05484.1 hypothetical protein BAURA86_04109 [Brevibacterium aurantiacum]
MRNSGFAVDGIIKLLLAVLGIIFIGGLEDFFFVPRWLVITPLVLLFLSAATHISYAATKGEKRYLKFPLGFNGLHNRLQSPLVQPSRPSECLTAAARPSPPIKLARTAFSTDQAFPQAAFRRSSVGAHSWTSTGTYPRQRLIGGEFSLWCDGGVGG